MAGSAEAFGRMIGDSVALATCPGARVQSVRSCAPRTGPKENAGKEGSLPGGFGAVKENPAAEGTMEALEDEGVKEKREEELEGRLKERPVEDGAAGAAEVEAGVMEDV